MKGVSLGSKSVKRIDDCGFISVHKPTSLFLDVYDMKLKKVIDRCMMLSFVVCGDIVYGQEYEGAYRIVSSESGDLGGEGLKGVYSSKKYGVIYTEYEDRLVNVYSRKYRTLLFDTPKNIVKFNGSWFTIQHGNSSALTLWTSEGKLAVPFTFDDIYLYDDRAECRIQNKRFVVRQGEQRLTVAKARKRKWKWLAEKISEIIGVKTLEVHTISTADDLVEHGVSRSEAIAHTPYSVRAEYKRTNEHNTKK